MSKKIIHTVYSILLLGIVLTCVADAADVVPHVFVNFRGNLSGITYTLSHRELDVTGSFAAHHGTEIILDGLGILTDADQAGQESFQFNASRYNSNGIEFTGIPFVVEAVFTRTDECTFRAPVIDIGGQCFIRFDAGLSAGNWDGTVEASNNDIQPIPEIGQTLHYAIVYDGGDIIDYYLNGIRIFQSDNGSPQEMTPLISWGNIRHTSVDGGRQIIGQYDSVAFSTFTGSFNPVTDFILPEGLEFRELPSNPSPAPEAIDVLQDTDLSWTPGIFADKHDIYFGTDFEDVNNAGRANPLNVLDSQGWDANTYDPGRLEFGQQYFWRIDEVNAPPDPTIFKGDIWSFTVESLAYQIPGQRITATACSHMEGQGPEKTIDGSGLVDDLHSISLPDMWMNAMGDSGPAWIQYEFDKIYKLHEMLVWNFNGPSVLVLFGLKDVTVEYSIDGANWEQVGNITEFAQATGKADYAANTIVAFEGAIAKYVRITSTSSWGGEAFNQFGLSEVRFMQIPTSARTPDPEDGAINIAIDVTLGWKKGREAIGHNVYFSADAQAVIDGTAPAVTVDHASYGPLSLDLNSSYYWQIDEVNDFEIHPIWQGDIWSFTTQEYLVVEDFELYNDIPDGQKNSNLVYMTWVDGFDNPSTNGSTIGYLEPFQPSMETGVVHGGRQSVPVMYNNSIASSSEVTANTNNLATGPDWSKGSPDALVLWIYGDPNNSVTDQMYVKVNDAKVINNIDLTQAVWQELTIDLISLGINLSNVTTLSIGFERTGAIGGSGMVFIDDIRLYAY